MKKLFYCCLLLLALPFAAAAQNGFTNTSAKTTATEKRLIASALYLSSGQSDSFIYQYSGNRGGTATGIQLFDTCIYLYGPAPGALRSFQRMIKAYDATDNTQWAVYQSWGTAGPWVNEIRYAFTYDAAGDTLSQLTQVWDESLLVWVNSACDSNYYSGGLKQSRSRNLWIAGAAAWIPSEHWLFTYAGSRLSESLHQLYAAPGWNDDVRVSYTYDGSGLLTTQTSERYRSGGWENMALNIYSYDAADMLTSVLEQQWTGGAWRNYRETMTEYNADALPATIYTRAWTTSTDIDTYQRADLVYNSDKLLATQTLNNWDGVSPGLPNVNVRYYYYEEYTTAIAAIAKEDIVLSLYPVPANRELTVAITAPGAQTLTLQLCDLQGHLLYRRQQVIQSGVNRAKLDVGALPPGNYLLRLQGDGQAGLVKTFSVQR